MKSSTNVSDPCICGDKTTWHRECYRSIQSPAQEKAALEHQARYGRELAQRLDALVERCRDDAHVPTYQDLLTVKGCT